MEATYMAYSAFLQEKKLMGTRCKRCDRVMLPPRSMCPNCFGAEVEWQELSGQGTLLTYTVIHVPPSSFVARGFGKDNPYCVGIVRLKEGPQISAQILGVDPKRPDQIQVGMPVIIDFSGGTGLAFRVTA